MVEYMSKAGSGSNDPVRVHSFLDPYMLANCWSDDGIIVFILFKKNVGWSVVQTSNLCVKRRVLNPLGCAIL